MGLYLVWGPMGMLIALPYSAGLEVVPNISSGKQQIRVDEFNRCAIIQLKLLASPFGSSPVDLA